MVFALLLALQLVACTTTTTTNEGGRQVTRQKSEPNLKDASNINVQLAVGYIQRKQYKAARDKLEKAIDQDDKNLPAYKTLAYLYALLGLEKEADEKYHKALDLKPDDPDLLNSYGAFLCSVGRLDEANKVLAQSYNNPFYETAYLAESNAGSCYIKQNKYKEAEALLRKSLRVQPKLPGSLISMAEIGVKTDRYLMARAYIERYHAVTKPTAESLWLATQAERGMGDKDHYMKYARQLIQDFPDSDQAGWIEAQAKNERLR
jgi:type IV pilus assembly protein PilF